MEAGDLWRVSTTSLCCVSFVLLTPLLGFAITNTSTAGPANGIDYSSGAAAGNRTGRLTPEVRYTKRSHYMVSLHTVIQ